MNALSSASPAVESQVRPGLVMLDLDGVLCLNTEFGGFDVELALSERHPHPDAVFGRLFAPSAKRALAAVHQQMEGDVRYVISSTWRESFDRDQMVYVFRSSGLEFVASHMYDDERWRTPIAGEHSRRVDDIAAWLDRHSEGEPFVILDDNHSGLSLSPALYLPSHPFAGRVVMCKESVGLTDVHVATIVAALRRPLEMPGGRS